MVTQRSRKCGSRRSADAVRVHRAREGQVRAGAHPLSPRSMSRPAVTTPPHSDLGVQVGLVVAAGAGHLRLGPHAAQRCRPGLGHRAGDRAPLRPRPRHPGRPPGARRGTGAHARGVPVVRRHDAPTGARAGRRPGCRSARPHGPAGTSQPSGRGDGARHGPADRLAYRVDRRGCTVAGGGPGGVAARRRPAGCRGSRLEGARRRSPGARDRGAARPVPEGVPAEDGIEGREDGTEGTESPPWLARPRGGGVQGGLAAVAYVEHLMAGAAGRRLATVLPGGPLVWRLATRDVARRARRGDVAGLDPGDALDRGRCSSRRAGARRRRGHPLARAHPERGPGQPRAVGHARQGGAAPHGDPRASGSAGRATAACPTSPSRPSWVHRRSPHRSRCSWAGQRADGAGTGRPRPRRDGAHRCVRPVPARPRVADRAGLRQLRGHGRRPVPHPRRRRIGHLQYSNRPSPLSLGRVARAREQNRLLWLRVLERLHHREGPRPGSSCSARASGRTPARTSSCTGAPWAWSSASTGPVDRHPHGSGWMHEVTGPDRLDVDRRSVAVVNDLEQPRFGTSAGCTRGTSC